MELLWLGGMLLREKVGAHTMDMTKGAMVQLKETVMFSCILSIVCPFDVLHLLHVAMGERY